MNLQRVLETKYDLFDKFGNENKQKSIDAVNYLAAISSENRIPFEAMDVLACIGTGKGNEILTSKNAINKRFFEYTKSFEPDTSNGLTLEDIARINKSCDKIAKNLHEQKKRVIKDNMDNIVGQCNDLQLQLSNNFGAIVRLRRELEVVGAIDGTNYSKAFQAVQQNGFFKFQEIRDIGNNQVLANFLTPEEVFWDLPNGRGRAKFGQFRLEYNMGNGFCGIFPHKNNVMVAGKYHFPYEFSRGHNGRAPGAMCLGNFNSKMAECHKNGDIEGIFIILRALIESDGGGEVHIDPTYWNLDSTIQCTVNHPGIRNGTMVSHVKSELSYVEGHCALIYFLPKNSQEAYAMHQALCTAIPKHKWWEAMGYSTSNIDNWYERKSMLYLYKNFIEGKHGEPCQEWKDWAAKNPEHRDVTHKE